MYFANGFFYFRVQCDANHTLITSMSPLMTFNINNFATYFVKCVLTPLF